MPSGHAVSSSRRRSHVALGHFRRLGQEKRARRIFWKDVRDIEKQIRRWRGQRLDRLVNRLVELHRALLGNNQSAELLLSQGLAEIARAAAPRK